MEVLEERSQKSPENEEYPLMAFIANIGVAPKGDRFDRGALVKDAENKLYKQTELNDFIYSSNNLETGSIGLNKFGKASISPVYSIFKITELADADFLGRRLGRKDFINSMIRYRQGVVYGQWRIHESDFINLNLRLPNIIEQRKIGEFLDNLDHLITLQQCEHHFLHSDSKSPFSESVPPHIEEFTATIFHFSTNTWEQRKFKEIVYRSNDTSNSLELPKLEYEDINSGLGTLNKDISIKKDSRKGLLFTKGDVLFGKLRPYLKNWWLAEFDGIAMGDFWNLRSGSLLNTFLYTYIQSVSFQVVANDTSGTKMPRSDWKLISESTIKFPSISEQQSIGSFFSTLDHLITLQQCKPLVFINLILKAIS